MPRIRTIKPEYWADEKLAPMRPIDRLVFLGLLSMADDAGRLVDNVKSIDGFIFPDTDDSSRDTLETLASVGRIRRYRAESGQRILEITNWKKHQKVDKPSKHVLPPAPPDAPPSAGMATRSPKPPEPPATDSRELRETVDESSRSDLGPGTGDQGTGTVERERERADAEAEAEAEAAALAKPVADIARAALTSLMGNVGMEKIDEFLGHRRASTHKNWLKEFAVLVGPMSQFVAADLDGALSDALMLDEPVQGPHAIRSFCEKRHAVRTRTVTAAGSRLLTIQAGVSKRGEAVAEAGEIVGRIRRMADERYTQGSGTKRFIPIESVKALGAEIFEAYTNVGGMGRFLALEAKPEDIGFVIREFADQLDRARSPRKAREAAG